MKKQIKTLSIILCTILMISILIGCSSVFSAGLSGSVVDSESTSNPKTKISNVRVFAYTNKEQRDSDYDLWNLSKGLFNPSSSSDFVGSATTDDNGEFVIGKLVWENFYPKFGKTADYCEVFLLFYHEDYGLTKNTSSVCIMSDNSGTNILQELKRTRKTTSLNITVRNTSDNSIIDTEMNVLVSVPQSSDDNPVTRVYESTISGTNTINISYPRYLTDETKEYTPEISVSVWQDGDNITWKMSYYEDNSDTEKPYAFIPDSEETKATITKKIKGSSYPIDIHLKKTVFTVPSISGSIHSGDTERNVGLITDDSVLIKLFDGDKPCDTVASEVRTTSSGDGANNSIIKHGLFTNLGNDVIWRDSVYDGKYVTKEFKLCIDYGKTEENHKNEMKTIEVRSDITTLDVGVLEWSSQ